MQVVVHLIDCYDGLGDAFRATHDSVNRVVPPPFRLEQGEDCPLWQSRHAGDADMRPVRSDIPTLILTAEFDDRTPLEQGREIAASLSHGYLFQYPGLGHGQTPRSPAGVACYRSILQRFFVDPTHQPDGSCLDRLPPTSFLTSWPPGR